MTRRLRLALLVAALAAGGAMPSAGALDTARANANVTIAWFRSERIVSPRLKPSGSTIPGVPITRRGFNAHSDPALSPALLPHSLFQRPPPFQN